MLHIGMWYVYSKTILPPIYADARTLCLPKLHRECSSSSSSDLAKIRTTITMQAGSKQPSRLNLKGSFSIRRKKSQCHARS